jgi:hypothetical protein
MDNCNDQIQSYFFEHPATVMFAGPSKSGKTQLVKKIILNNNHCFSSPPERIYYCYSRWQSAYDEMKGSIQSIHFIQGLPSISIFDENYINLLIIDDLMSDAAKNDEIKEIFTVDSHHMNISVFFLVHNLFQAEKNQRTISLNINYLFLLNNPRDRFQIYSLARQLYPEKPKFIMECFRDAVEEKKYGYLFLDFTQSVNKNLKVSAELDLENNRLIKRVLYTPLN